MRVLVADDNVAVRELLKRYLLSWQYDVIEAVDGVDAWQIMRNDPPDIAVLDWMMPGVDGLALCDQYNELSDVPFIYFILLTAKNEKADLIYALSHGVHDYQTKPVDKDELFGRLAVARRLIDAQRKAIHATRQVERFRQNVEHLEQLADERAKQLIHADRLISLGTLSAGMAHEISNALGYICDGAYELQYQLDHVQPLLRVAVETAAPNHKKDMADFLVQCPSSVESIHEGINKVVNIVEELRMFSRRGGDRKVKCSIDEPIRRALRLCNNALKYRITVQNEVDEAAPVVHMNVQLVEQVFVNLFKNAADAMAESTPALLSISYTKEEENVRILVRDTGPGIPAGKIDEIWTAFYTTKDPEKGTGLGLAISRDIILKHGGEIWVENLLGGGAQFSILLPLPANIRVPGECPDECEKA